MATVLALPGKWQMINGDGKFSGRTASFTGPLKNYTVVSIIGPQSSGKSFLLNSLFKTEFEVLNGAEGRKQTTKGIWIARCTNPSLVIMDVEGFDGKERGEDDTLFERQSALFSLIVSDVLLLNMWIHDIGRQKGSNIELIELIFKERVKIVDATKTTIIIVMRDYDNETPLRVITKQLENTITEIWEKVNSSARNRRMSDYIEVIVKDFPSKKFQKREFDQKCEDLSKFICSIAENENKEQTEYGSGFAISSEEVWDGIRSNKEIIPADHKIAKSQYQCKKITKSLLTALDEEKGHWMGDLSIPVKEFSAEFSSIYKDILTRYEEQITASIMRSVRDERKVKLDKKLLEKFQIGLYIRLQDLAARTLSRAKSELRPMLEKCARLDKYPTTGEVIKPYLKIFDENSPSEADLRQYSQHDCIFGLREIRLKFEYDLTKHADEEAHVIQIYKSIFMSKKIVKMMTDSFDQQAHNWINNLDTPAKQFTTEFSILRGRILTRYEEETASLSSAIRDAEKAELEMRFLDRFREGLFARLHVLANTTLVSAKSNLKKQMEKLEDLNNSSVIEELRSYVAEFDNNTPNDTDLEWYPATVRHHLKQLIYLNIRQQLVTELTKYAEKCANKIKSRRDFLSGIKNVGKLILGTAWAAVSGDSSILISSIAAMAVIRNVGRIALSGNHGTNRITWADTGLYMQDNNYWFSHDTPASSSDNSFPLITLPLNSSATDDSATDDSAILKKNSSATDDSATDK